MGSPPPLTPRPVLCALVGLVAIVAAVMLGVGSAGAGASGSTPTKKRCHVVKKKVRGKIKRVRVCEKPKPKPKPRVIDVSVALQAGRATTFELTPSGGTAVVRAASGARLTLSIPQGATASAVTVRMTPIGSFKGLPFRSLVGGVHLQPDGLQLARPAKLTIAAPRVPAGRVFGFTYTGNGRNLRPERVTQSGRTLSFKVSHFSGYGAGVGGDAIRYTLLGPLLAEWGLLNGEFRAGALDPARFADSGLLPRYLAWKASALAYGFPELASQVAELTALAMQTVDAALAHARSRCAAQHELKPSFDAFRALQLAAVFGIGELVRVPPSVVLEACLRFELDIEFRTVLHGEARGGGATLVEDGDLRTAARKVQITMPTLRGVAALQIDNWAFTYSAALPTLSCSGQQLSAVATRPLDVRLEVEAGFENVTGHPELTLFIGPGDVDASVHVTCSNGGSSTEKVIDYGALWRGAFSDRARPDGTLRFDILPPFGQHLGGTVFATYGPDTRPFEYAWGYGKVTASETIRFTLRHVPAP